MRAHFIKRIEIMSKSLSDRFEDMTAELNQLTEWATVEGKKAIEHKLDRLTLECIDMHDTYLAAYGTLYVSESERRRLFDELSVLEEELHPLISYINVLQDAFEFTGGSPQLYEGSLTYASRSLEKCRASVLSLYKICAKKDERNAAE